MTAIVRCDGVGKEYDAGITALRNVTFDVPGGQGVAIVGRNGAGKSTLLKLIAGITSPTHGVVERPRRTTSLIELSAAFEPDLTGRENLDVVLAIAGLKRRRRKRAMETAIHTAGIGSAIGEPVKHYSSGMVARLSLAGALATEPDLLLIDEVLAVGDLAFQRSAIEAIRELIRHGSSLLLVTHSLELARSVSSRCLWIEDGALRRDGSVEAVTDEYDQSFGRASRRSGMTHTRFGSARVTPTTIHPGDAIEIQATLERLAEPGPVVVRVDVRPPVLVEGESDWMRRPNETGKLRELNVVGRTQNMPTELPVGRHVVTIGIDNMPITPCDVDITIVAVDPYSDEILDEIDVPLDIVGPKSAPRVHLSAGVAPDA